MLATPADPHQGLPGDARTWAYEVKWDGMRVVAEVADGVLTLRSRTGKDVTAAFPELAGLAEAHPGVVLDGEVVVLREGVPSFAALADRMHVRDVRRARELARVTPATFIAFDVLSLYGVDLTGRPWQERREALERLAPSGSAWQLSPVYDDGPALLAATREQGLEGVMAKRRTSVYTPGARTADWIKVPHRRSQTCLVGGWRPETTTATRIGALLVGVWEPDGAGEWVLQYRGRVGSGITASAQQDLHRLLTPLRRAAMPFVEVPAIDADGARWVEPHLVVEVRYKGRSAYGRLREPVFRGLRADVDPDTVTDDDPDAERSPGPADGRAPSSSLRRRPEPVE